MKRLICVLLTLLLVVCLPMTAWAESQVETAVQQAQEQSQVLSAYRIGDSLHSFVKFEGGVPSADVVRLVSGTEENAEQLPASQVKNCALDNPVRLVLLVDNSTSMEAKRDTLLVFAEELMKRGPRGLAVTVVTQANGFQILAEEVTDVDQLKEAVRAIPYNGNYVTDIMAGLANALDCCFDVDSYRQGSMQNLLVFTNGAVNLSWEERLVSISKAKAAMEKAPGVLVHSVFVEDKKTEERTVLEKSNGAHLLLTDNQTQETASGFAKLLSGIHRVEVTDPKVRELSLNGLSLKYSVRSGENMVLHDVPLGTIADLTEEKNEGAPAATEPTEQSEASPTVPETEPDGTQPEEGSGETTPTGETEPTGTEETEQPQETTAESGEVQTSEVNPEPGNEGFSKLWLFVGIGGVVLVALAVVLILVLRRRATDGIAMRLIVEYGEVPNIREWYYLKDSFYLGSGRGCDVVIPESLVDKKNTRIYLDNGQIFVEDLGSRAGTLLGGMKLHGPNRLRSGDVVTVGNTSVRFLF